MKSYLYSKQYIIKYPRLPNLDNTNDIGIQISL